MHANYAAWNIDLAQVIREAQTEEELFTAFVCAGLLAPSTHNIQPWEFVIEENRIFIYSSQKRTLPETDPDGKLLAISMGACIEAIHIAAEAAGYVMQIALAQHEQPGALFATLTLRKNEGVELNSDSLLSAITKRRTNRFPYTSVLVDEKVVSEMKQHASLCSTTLLPFSALAQKEAIANILLDSRETLFDNPRFRAEMAAYKRSNITTAHTGMPGFTMGFSLFVSLFSPFVIKHVNVVRPIREKELLLLTKETPTMCFVATSSDTQEDWCNAGRAYMRAVLVAELAGYATAISAVPRAKQPLADALATDFHAHLFFRIGIPTQTSRHSPRLQLSQLLRANIQTEHTP